VREDDSVHGTAVGANRLAHKQQVHQAAQADRSDASRGSKNNPWFCGVLF
jgi:hypothetical protein